MKQYLLIVTCFFYGISEAQVSIVDRVGSIRTSFARQKIMDMLIKSGLDQKNHRIILEKKKGGKKEGFTIRTVDGVTRIIGTDDSGILYGCLDWSERVLAAGAIPARADISDAPRMVMRGSCIGLQKPYYLPGRTVYEYPYTPEVFPWFYDKTLWVRVLDSMLHNRMNSLYLWNGHPFASLVRLPEYPYAVEVDDDTFRKNEDIYRFITTEADKRGIWIIQMFYNIIVSKPFAEKHGIRTQDRERPILPLIADYTRKSIAAFVRKYPNVGLMVCLGEAMEGTGNDDTEWFIKTIIPGVKDGLRAVGRKDEPPIVLRAHDTDAPAVMRAALPIYKNLYTEAKFNGEALTYDRPRGSWAKLHQTLAGLGSVQIENVHILANLEPFRYGSPAFIQACVTGMREVMAGNGLHLYPQASYWDWPYTADSIRGGRLLQIERDWIWYRAWSRYAWLEKRDRAGEIVYWASMLAERYGCSQDDAKLILDAYEQSGEIAPKLLRRFGITDGNRQTLTLGMLMTQLINPYRYGLFTLLYDAEAPEGEMLIDYADKEWKGLPHVGETPVQVIREVRAEASAAVASVDLIGSKVTRNREEFLRLRNDMHCYRAMAMHFAAKAEASLWVLRYKYSRDISDLERAAQALRESLEEYRKLVTLTLDTYLYANSMQTQQRKIPMRGVDGTYKHWKEMLPVFENELQTLVRKTDSLRAARPQGLQSRTPMRNAEVEVSLPFIALDSGVSLFDDTSSLILQLAPELKGMKGLRLSYREQLLRGTSVSFSSDRPVKVLVGYFKAKQAAFKTDSIFLKPPELENDASADNQGQADIRIANAMAMGGMPALDLHAYHFPAGRHTLVLSKGVCAVLGFVDGKTVLPEYDALLSADDRSRNLDWLFE